MAFLFRVLFCVFISGFFLYLFVAKQNQLTEIRLTIPALQKELQKLRAENQRLQYEIDSFESPLKLMELSEKPIFHHLKQPYLEDIITLPTGESQEESLVLDYRQGPGEAPTLLPFRRRSGPSGVSL